MNKLIYRYIDFCFFFQETFLIFLERYALNSHWYLFAGDSGYNIYKGLFVLWFSLTATLIWNFIDLFIMLISIALAAQFGILNKALQFNRGKVVYFQYINFKISLGYYKKIKVL